MSKQPEKSQPWNPIGDGGYKSKEELFAAFDRRAGRRRKQVFVVRGDEVKSLDEISKSN